MLSTAACGPSLTTVHEGTIRFEHCYRLDLEPGANAAQRTGCWKLWLASYTYGQQRDRIDHARQRLTALSGGDVAHAELRVAGDPRPEERQFYLVVPGPTSVHATPPPIATVLSPSVAETRAAEAAGRNAPPSESCAGSCRSAWRSCDASCKEGSALGCDGCRADYSTCMRGCFE